MLEAHRLRARGSLARIEGNSDWRSSDWQSVVRRPSRSGLPFLCRASGAGLPYSGARVRATAGLVAIAGTLQCPGASAQLPLSIEQLLVERQQLQVLTAADYGVSSPLPGVDLSSGGIATALRYGIGRHLEVNAAWRRERWRQAAPAYATGGEQDRLSLGVTWMVRREERLPAVLLGIRGWRDSSQGRGAAGGEVQLTVYRSLDPVVLSLQAAVAQQDAVQRHDGNASSWRLSPQVNFAVNPRVTLIAGVNYQRRFDATTWARSRADTMTLRTGLGFAIGARDTVFVMADSAASGIAGRMLLQWFHQF